MKELKTLDNLNFEQKGYDIKRMLKAEAVKWIDNLWVDEYTKGRNDFIKHFFNLTEEDLK